MYYIIPFMVELVGILNVTPDSFSDGGLFVDPEAAVKQADKLFSDGASLVDVGAESTRPNAAELSPGEEWHRLEPVLKVLLRKYPGQISLDSYHPETIERAASLGGIIVNDVTGMNNPAMVDLVSSLKPIKVIISHLPNMPIQKAHEIAPVSNMSEVKNDLLERAATLEARGYDRDRIILDPGIGFGKTMELNERLLTFADQVPDYAVMIGHSRKRFLGEKRMELEPNLRAARIAIRHGARYLRVHDIAGHSQLLEGFVS